jgi:hypothetical protein
MEELRKSLKALTLDIQTPCRALNPEDFKNEGVLLYTCYESLLSWFV